MHVDAAGQREHGSSHHFRDFLCRKEVEVVERKGLGHPDTICDALAESFSQALCREYRQRFGEVLHHNVDKALLLGGRATPQFRGGKLITCAGGKIPLCNDTSIGVGHAPLSRLERLVLAVEKQINARDRFREAPAWGEDIKIMGIRSGDEVRLTIACAMICGHLVDIDDYLHQKAALQEFARKVAAAHGFPECRIDINMADQPASGDIYLTVTGTSAEAGDDGEVGRGNRVNGLITPCRPMTLEAAAGKNPISHIGKVYNVLARQIAEWVVAEIRDIAYAECWSWVKLALLSRARPLLLSMSSCRMGAECLRFVTESKR